MRSLGARFEQAAREIVSRIPAVVIVIAALAGSWALQRRADALLSASNATARSPRHAVAPLRAGRVASVRTPGELVKAGEIVATLQDAGEHHELRSPVDGAVTAVLRNRGEHAAAGEAVLTIAAAGHGAFVTFQ